jgi:hypothetical protein
MVIGVVVLYVLTGRTAAATPNGGGESRMTTTPNGGGESRMTATPNGGGEWRQRRSRSAANGGGADSSDDDGERGEHGARRKASCGDPGRRRRP